MGKHNLTLKTFANESLGMYFLLDFSGGKSPTVDADILQGKKKSIASAVIYFSVIAAPGFWLPK